MHIYDPKITPNNQHWALGSLGRRTHIKGLLEAGHAVQFNYPNGVTKIVTKFELNDAGDLVALNSTGLTTAVMWDAPSLPYEDLGVWPDSL